MKDMYQMFMKMERDGADATDLGDAMDMKFPGDDQDDDEELD